MGRFLTLMTLLILGALAVRTQQPSPYETHGVANGLAWRADSYREKLSYTDGAMDGLIAGVHMILNRQQGDCKRSVEAAFPDWTHFNVTNGDFVREMDAFYQDGARISLPMSDAFKYSGMKLGGASKEMLDDFLDTARRAQIRLDK